MPVRFLPLVIALTACKVASTPDLGATGDLSASPSFDAANDSATAVDAAISPDLAQGAGDCVLTLSGKSMDCTATQTDLTFPFLFAVGKGVQCNAATVPTLCSLASTLGNVTTFGSYQSFDSSLGPGTAVPFISAIAVQKDTAIFTYIEEPRRWHAQPGGTFVIDQLSGHRVSLHFVVDLMPDTKPDGAVGTFTINGVCTDIDFRP